MEWHISQNLGSDFVISGIVMSWFGLYARRIALALTIVLWLTIPSALTKISEGGVTWIAKTLLVNFTLILSWAGGLYLYLHRYTKQRKALKVVIKPLRFCRAFDWW